jgi:3-phenylpropionate/cinnamic acid dioxygenase small subunit
MCDLKINVALVAFALLGVSFTGHAGIPVTVSAADRQKILDLISASSYTYDGKDLESYLALFTKDCVLEIFPTGAAKPTVRAANRSELRAVVVQRFAVLREKGIQSRHYQTNTLLTQRADGQVAGTTMLNLMWQLPGEKPYTVTTGIYRDLFVKTEGGWKLATRTLLMDQGEMGK